MERFATMGVDVFTHKGEYFIRAKDAEKYLKLQERKVKVQPITVNINVNKEDCIYKIAEQIASALKNM